MTVRRWITFPPRAGRPVFDGPDLLALVVLSASCQALYLAMTRIAFDCDALTFVEMARSLSGQTGHYLPFRGIGYPAFLVATGQTFFGTFYGTIAVQALLGIATPPLVYLTLRPVSRSAALLAAGILIATSLPFMYAKVMIPQQLFMFLVVGTAYCFSRYYFTRDPRFIYLIGILGVLALFTRGEGLPLLPIFALLSGVWVLRDSRNQVGHFVLAGVVTAVVFFSYSVARSVVLKDPSVRTSLSNWGGRQLFLQPYYIQNEQLMRFRRHVLGTEKEGDPEPRLVQPDNGPASKRFYELMVDLYSDPRSYRYLEPLLNPESAGGVGNKFDPNNIYYDMFGRFEGRPLDLARNVFDKPHEVYFDNLWPLMDKRLGIAESNALFQAVTYEAIKKNPDILLAFVHNAAWYLGIDLLSILEGHATVPETLRQITAWASEDRTVPGNFLGGVIRNYVFNMYLYPPFNVANCARSGLPASMFQEYERDFANTDQIGLAALLPLLEAFSVIVMFVAGVGFVVLSWVLVVSRQKVLWLGFASSAIAMLAIVSLANTTSAKYDPSLWPLVVMVFSGALLTLIKMCGRRFWPGRSRSLADV